MRIASRPPPAELVGKHSGAYGRPLRPETDGYLADGKTVRVRFEEDGTKVISRLGRTSDPNDPEARLAGTRWGIGGSNFDEWPRFGAKVALGLASIVLDDRWLGTRGARAVQAMFSGQPWKNVLAFDPDLWACYIGASDPFASLAAGEHVVGLCDFGEDGPCAWMILFGAVAYRMSLPDADIPPEQPTWLLTLSRTTPSGWEPLETVRARYEQAT